MEKEDDMEVRTLYNILRKFHKIMVHSRATHQLSGDDIDLLNDMRVDLIGDNTLDRLSTKITSRNYEHYLKSLIENYMKARWKYNAGGRQAIWQLAEYVEGNWKKKLLSKQLQKIDKKLHLTQDFSGVVLSADRQLLTLNQFQKIKANEKKYEKTFRMIWLLKLIFHGVVEFVAAIAPLFIAAMLLFILVSACGLTKGFYR